MDDGQTGDAEQAEQQQQQKQLREEGFCVVRKVLPDKLIRALCAAVDTGVIHLSDGHRWNDRYQGDHLYIGFSDLDMEREGATRDDVYAQLIAAPGLVGAFTATTGSAPVFWAGSVMSKPVGGPPLYWHHDWAFFDHDVGRWDLAPQIFVMVYLTATTPENGCLRVIPGR